MLQEERRGRGRGGAMGRGRGRGAAAAGRGSPAGGRGSPAGGGRGSPAGGRGAGGSDSAGSSPQPPSLSPLQLFQTARFRVIERGFLSWPALEKELSKIWPRHPPKEVSEALFGLRTMLTEVNTTVSIVFSTHHLVTLHDLEKLVLSTNKTFEAVSSFDELKLGSLATHPAVRVKFAEEALAVAAPKLTAQAVLEHIATALEQKWRANDTAKDRLDMDELLAELAAEQGLPGAASLGVFIRSKGFLIGLVARLVGARNRAEKLAERSAAKRIKETCEAEAAERVREEAALKKATKKQAKAAEAAVRVQLAALLAAEGVAHPAVRDAVVGVTVERAAAARGGPSPTSKEQLVRGGRSRVAPLATPALTLARIPLPLRMRFCGSRPRRGCCATRSPPPSRSTRLRSSWACWRTAASVVPW